MTDENKSVFYDTGTERVRIPNDTLIVFKGESNILILWLSTTYQQSDDYLGSWLITTESLHLIFCRIDEHSSEPVRPTERLCLRHLWPVSLADNDVQTDIGALVDCNDLVAAFLTGQAKKILALTRQLNAEEPLIIVLATLGIWVNVLNDIVYTLMQALLIGCAYAYRLGSLFVKLVIHALHRLVFSVHGWSHWTDTRTGLTASFVYAVNKVVSLFPQMLHRNLSQVHLPGKMTRQGIRWICSSVTACILWDAEAQLNSKQPEIED
ncbi:hypothetical protein CLF_112503 [Clonorchis sinensis]|uniref:Uncharacterized protein n=1 Tax=Clonorchis sinensis TaxID=79923 RepID=G7YWH0_CLOSI|nr:hypothetical protein CLF_112503 [Clonorchis sinensis]